MNFTIECDGDKINGKASFLLKCLMKKYLDSKVLQITDSLFEDTKIIIDTPLSRKKKKEKDKRIEQVSFRIPTKYYCPAELQYNFEMSDDEVKAIFGDEDI